METSDFIREGKLNFALIGKARNRRCRARLWCAGKGDMPLGCKKPRGWIKPYPACPWQIDFAPGMQIGKVGLRARRTIERFLIGFKLDQIARCKTGGQTKVTQ